MNKAFKIIGILISVVIIVFGILVMTGTFKDSTSYPDSAPSSYDSGYAIFGADFYNYVCNNSAEAADAARAAAYNTIDIIDTVTSGFGAIIIAIGLLGFCFFGMMPAGPLKVQAIAPARPASPVYAAPAPVKAPVAPVQTAAPEGSAVKTDSAPTV